MSNPTQYHDKTPATLRALLDALTHSGRRVRVFFGDTATGADWCEEHDVTGYIGKSTGSHPIPLLVHNSRSLGGGRLLDHCIVKVVETKTGRVLYQHPNYHIPARFIPSRGSSVVGYGAQVYREGTGELYANCVTFNDAERLAAFMNGERMSK